MAAYTDYIHVGGPWVRDLEGCNRAMCYLQFEEMEYILGEEHRRRAASKAERISDLVCARDSFQRSRTWYHKAQRSRMREVIERSADDVRVYGMHRLHVYSIVTVPAS